MSRNPTSSQPRSIRHSGAESPLNCYLAEEDRNDGLGLAFLYEPENRPLADLIFVHGHGGGSVKSWTNEKQSGISWPLEWLPNEQPFNLTRISICGYSSSAFINEDQPFNVLGYAEDFLAKLRMGCGRRSEPPPIGSVPIIFIARSLGGLVVKQAYLLAATDFFPVYGPIFHATSAFMFFSTPHHGLDEPSVVRDILSAFSVSINIQNDASDDFLRYPLNLQAINDKFHDLATSLHIYSFFKQPQGKSWRLGRDLVLPQTLLTLDHPSETQLPLDAEQLTGNKYASNAHPNFEAVRGAFWSALNKSRTQKSSAFVPTSEGETREADYQTKVVGKLFHGFEAPQDDLSFFSDRRATGSCEWVIDHPSMDAFLQNLDPYPLVLWCSGSAGSGKSVTATFLIEYLLDESRSCAYYYFRSGRQDKNHLGRFLTSIASQLSEFLPEYNRKLSTLVEDPFNVGKVGHKLLWKKLFVSTLLQCSPADPFYIVIDGLDEFTYAKELIERMFADLENAPIRIRLVLVSRQASDIETSVERLSQCIPVQRMYFECNAEDLDMYVRNEMDIGMREDTFRDRIIEQILMKANGNFLWASLVVQEISECQTEAQIEEALSQVPTELEPLYKRMDDRLADLFVSRSQERRMGHSIIEWAVCARLPLHLDVVKAALDDEFSPTLDMHKTIQKVCGEFILVDKKGFISLVHASAKEFLTSNPRLNYYVSIPEAHKALFRRCIHAIPAGHNNIDASIHSASGFVKYAASSWPFHLVRGSLCVDQDCLTTVSEFLTGQVILDWMFVLACAGELGTMIEASQALSRLLKAVDEVERENNPLIHRLGDMETLQLWAQDLIRVVGRFGLHLLRQPGVVYDLIPALCPQESIIYRQFYLDPPFTALKADSHLVVRGSISPTWDESLTKFAITGDALPQSILSLDRYLAILTKGTGVVHLYHSATCEVAHRLQHGEIVLTFCVDLPLKRIATYGFRKTSIWNIESGKLMFSVENPRYAKALAMSFQQSQRGDDVLLTFSDDRQVRVCSLESMRLEWSLRGTGLDNDLAELPQINSPHNARFSDDGIYLAISYRGAHPLVWQVGDAQPQFIARCDHRSRHASTHSLQYTRDMYAQSFAWNQATGHLLGAFNDGLVFKWHPVEDDFVLSDLRGESIKCSADGRLFVTGSYDGNLRIWNFDHFTPIYHSRYPLGIQDVELDRSEARVYDLRDQYCNIWEPSSLLRAMESDDGDIASDAQSSRESDMPSLASEAVKEDFEPITTFAARDDTQIYATGDDAGRIKISDFSGVTILDLVDGPMSLEKLEWCERSNLLASFDLGREVAIREVWVNGGEQDAGEAKSIKVFTENEVSQLLFDAAGDRIMVASSRAVKIYLIREAQTPVVRLVAQLSRWILHPEEGNIALGFSAGNVTVMPWTNPSEMKVLEYNKIVDEAEAAGDSQSPNLRPSMDQVPMAIPTSPAEVDRTAHKVYISPDAALAIVDIYAASKQSRRRVDCLLVETAKIALKDTRNSVSIRSMPTIIANVLYMPLGFIDPNSLTSPPRDGSQANQAKSWPRKQPGLHCFVFIDKEFWVCSVGVSFNQNRPLEIFKHFFLPRDWQNAEWLDMATVMRSGDFLCPHNGDVAVVSNGFQQSFGQHYAG